MNERIRELAVEAEEYAFNEIQKPQDSTKWKSYTQFYNEKFAELIVLECVSLCEDLKFQHRGYRMEETDFGMKNIYAEGEATCDLLQYKMKKHFGVEE